MNTLTSRAAKKLRSAMLLAACLLALPLAVRTHAQVPGSPTALTPAEDAFIRKAAIGGMAEVRLGKIAEERGQSAEVRAFGKKMVADHSKANDELKALAGGKGVALPSELDGEHQAKVDVMMKLSGSDFDHAYLADMVEDHQKDVAEFEKASKDAKDPGLKAFVEKTLPTLRAHLKHVTGLKPKPAK